MLVQLIRNLSPGGRLVLRIGGQSQDRSWWPVPGMRRSPGISYDLGPRWLADADALAQATDARGVGLRRLAQELARALAALPKQVPIAGPDVGTISWLVSFDALLSARSRTQSAATAAPASATRSHRLCGCSTPCSRSTPTVSTASTCTPSRDWSTACSTSPGRTVAGRGQCIRCTARHGSWRAPPFAPVRRALVRLRAAGGERATGGITLGAQSFGAETRTGLLPALVLRAVSPRRSAYAVTLSPGSAALLTFPKG